MKKIIKEYNNRKHDIKKRLSEFKKVQRDEDIFAELCFCILTPQSKAVNCDKAIRKLRKSGLLFVGSATDIRPILKGLSKDTSMICTIYMTE